MKSAGNIFKTGVGPSSSHTMGPKRASEKFLAENKNAFSFQITLLGSLAATGKGHLTDKAIIETFLPRQTEIVWKPETTLPFHPNAMIFKAFDKNNNLLSEKTYYSIGGGEIVEENAEIHEPDIYPHHKFNEILRYCHYRGMSLWEYVYSFEDATFTTHLTEVWKVMKEAVRRGIQADGIIPGGLGISRKASSYFQKAKGYRSSLKRRALAYAYALAVAEENACGGKIVTAPTCGSCGVLPGLLYLLQESYKFSDEQILKALATAGLIGMLVKTNASISGAEVGCQGEIGTACSMASGAAAQLFGGSIFQIEYAAEIGLEHHLGLTCDPVEGLVQVPCIERNAFAVSRALDASHFALLSDGRHLISFDEVVFAMKQTGHDLPSLYRETSGGGLAKVWNIDENENL
ncbi:MAG TPA: L-serine ammonia-lyase [Bacteroidia bacterium]|nr:L-serine ammonia-lyase [Bacteroidia bacterium]HRS59528.1 L-serine ammonia-lyase [Bacteroidia bacterium]HRU67580.1 L-serine ammonia-lyase [Bacteroidia bacterium]